MLGFNLLKFKERNVILLHALHKSNNILLMPHEACKPLLSRKEVTKAIRELRQEGLIADNKPVRLTKRGKVLLKQIEIVYEDNPPPSEHLKE